MSGQREWLWGLRDNVCRQEVKGKGGLMIMMLGNLSLQG